LKKGSLIFIATLFTASVAAATDPPPAQAFFGYNWVRFDADRTIQGTNTELGSFDLNGGNFQFAYNWKHGLGLALDIGVVHAGSVFSLANATTNHGIDHTLVDFALGPRYSFRKHSRWMPFAQALFGGARASSSTNVTLLQGGIIWPPPGVVIHPGTVQPVNVKLQADRTGFAMLVGGGLDIKISKHVAFRPIGADYYLTRLPTFLTGTDTNKNHFRYSAGVNFSFGER
jgi:opacity protein-like surface antigen